MSDTVGYDDVLSALEVGKASSGLRCPEVRRLLGELRFHVKDGKRGGHKVVTHPGIPASDFTSVGYNCEGGDGTVGRNYLGKLIRVVKGNKDALKKILGET